jgi:hypothetical protein
MTFPASNRSWRLALPAAAGLGLAWSLFGLLRFAQTSLASEAELLAGGMTPAQAALYAALPGWMTAAFALGVLGGTVGCALLLLRRRAAVPVLAASLAGYVVLFAGDVTEGVFAAFGPSQVVILTFVVAIAAGLLALARHAERLGLLRGMPADLPVDPAYPARS